ncbi:DUF433 domain-containing protein [Sulfobacillus harzensis]|uniref:DUF433 domain-containing protein n=1 Tax=Sulfobacillus harzensis TaxID=2729629 RepID=A0A7Y0L8L7_9FIRM|nr:DUF433 domain-containing protein [Sulfobacillus harzensis]NMP24495.1 DUF433 domain-containing protein [Sulfobacillus harzensis]
MVLEERDWDIITADEAARIQEDPAVLIGKPTLRNTRISVTQVLELLAEFRTIEDTTHELQRIVPTLEEADVQAAVRFAAVVCDRRLLDKPGWRTTDCWPDNLS